MRVAEHVVDYFLTGPSQYPTGDRCGQMAKDTVWILSTGPEIKPIASTRFFLANSLPIQKRSNLQNCRQTAQTGGCVPAKVQRGVAILAADPGGGGPFWEFDQSLPCLLPQLAPCCSVLADSTRLKQSLETERQLDQVGGIRRTISIKSIHGSLGIPLLLIPAGFRRNFNPSPVGSPVC